VIHLVFALHVLVGLYSFVAADGTCAGQGVAVKRARVYYLIYIYVYLKHETKTLASMKPFADERMFFFSP